MLPLLLTHQDDSALTGVSLVVQRGVPSDVVDLKILNTGTDTVEGAYLVLSVRNESTGVFQTEGHAAVDELMGRLQITGGDSSATPGLQIVLGQVQPMGHFAFAQLPPIPPGDWVLANFWLEQSAASTGGGGAFRVRLGIAPSQDAFPLVWGPSQVANGVDTGRKQPRSFFIQGRRPIPSGSPDAQVHAESGSWLTAGEEYSDGSTADVTLNQNDGAAAALGSGEEYWAVLTAGTNTAPTVTKGLKAVAGSAARPAPPAGENLLAWVHVAYGASGSVISSGDIEDARVFGRYLVAAPPTGLFVAVHPGEAIIGNFRQVRGKVADVTLFASSTNRVWLEWNGHITVTVSDTPPSAGAVKLAVVVTDASNCTSNTDTRRYIRPVDAGAGAADITDGVTTVSGFTKINLTSGATVSDAGGGQADVAIAGAGGGAVSAGPLASLPGSPSDGDVYYVTDAPIVATRLSGAWRYFRTGSCEVTPIDFASFTATENANTIRVATPGSVYVKPAGGATPFNYYKKSLPSTPYSCVVKFIVRYASAADYVNIGMFLRESSSGKMHVLELGFYSGTTHWFLRNAYYSNASTFSSDYVAASTPHGIEIAGVDGAESPTIDAASIHDRLVCLRMSDDGSHRTCDYSLDGGVTWTAFNPVSPVGHTTDLTPNEAGFCVGTFGGVNVPQVEFISYQAD